MDLLQTYHTVNSILDMIDFNFLFRGFHKYRFALYSSKEIVLDGKVLPPREDFIGNTAKEYDGEYIAIWNMEFDPVEDAERLAYLLVHEMFHCHQFKNKENRFPSDLDLLNYPGDVENFTKKYNENLYLADAYERQEMESFCKFISIRMKRHEKYPDMVCQEWKVETLEGMAEYIGLKALERINREKYMANVNNYLEILRKENKLLFDVRKISYYTGALYFLCLEKLGLGVNNTIGGKETAYEQNVTEVVGVLADIISYDFISTQLAELKEEKERTIRKHIERANYTECQAFICGYDPMNMFRQDDLIFCKHFVNLNENGKFRMIQSAVVLKLAEGSNRDVIGYYR